MSDEYIDAIIAESSAAATPEPAQQPAADAPKPDAAAKEPPADPNAEPNEADGDDDRIEFPKKALNALSRRDKTIGKLRAELAAARSANPAATPQPQPQPKPQSPAQPPAAQGDGAPKMEDYKNYADYLEARSDWKIEQALASRETKQQEAQQQTTEQKWVTERETAVETQAVEFIKATPDALAVVQENADVIDAFPAHIQRALLEADNAPLAVYNLAKEGKLEALASMSPAKAAMEIGRAQAQAPAKPQSKAPAPLAAARGSVAASKSLESMSGTELLQWVNS